MLDVSEQMPIREAGSGSGPDQLDSARAIAAENADLLALVGDFRQKTGRPLRVLHIGNVANNAYNNACIQRKFGIEADVLCYNYYHIMGCPEWEDSAVQGGSSALDHFKPDWWTTSLRGWKRPRWFVQGPSALCIEYLRAKNAGWISEANLKWLELELSALKDSRSADKFESAKKHIPTRLKFLLWLRASDGPSQGDKPRFNLYGLWLGRTVSREEVRQLAAVGIKGLMAALFEDSSSLARALLQRFLALLNRALLKCIPIPEAGCVARSMSEPVTRAKEIETLLDEIRSDPAELDSQSLSYREEYVADHPRPFGVILSHYDIVQGYAIDGLIPMMHGVKNFSCYEHGTLREIPFENNLTGLICRFSFQRAPAVFITNSDVLPSVERLGLKSDRVFYLPHAFDDGKLRSFRQAHPELIPPRSGPVVFFSPTRHHWKRGNLSWQKGNDVLIHAAAEVARETQNFKLVLVEWGQEVADSKGLIEELGLSNHVEWIPTMSKLELWQRYCTSHAVIDQFAIPALGGVGFEAMALGIRLISAIDRQQTRLFFGQEPPCLIAGNVAECASRMREVLDDPSDRRGRGAAASQWMSTYHSAERIVALQCKAYSGLLEGQW